MRLFVAVPLADAVVAELGRLCARLCRSDDGLRWTAPQSWHITLQFLGNSTVEQFGCVTARLAQVRAAAVPVRLGKIGCFERAGVLHLGVELTPQLAALQQQVTAATAACGFAAEDRPYHPHITLARQKGEGRGRELRGIVERMQTQPAFPPLTAVEFLLYESHLAPGGARYEVRARFRLASGQASA